MLGLMTVFHLALTVGVVRWEVEGIIPFHNDFPPSGEQLDLRKLAHEL